MKTAASLIMVVYLFIYAPSFGQGVTLSKKMASLETIFSEIQKQTGYNFFYQDKWLVNSQKVNINVINEPIGKVLDLCFSNQPFTYKITGTTIILSKRLTAEENPLEEPGASMMDITGVVRSEKGELLDGITIIAGYGRYATATNSAGQFSLKGIPSDAKLTITGTNIETYEVKLVGKKDLSLTVVTRVNTIEEVIVSTGYQELPRERATGSFVKINNELFNRKVSVNVLDRLDGITNGVLFDRRSGSLNIQVRGLFTLTESIAQPLIVMDNFPYEGNINNINPNDVESVTVLKDAAATSIWGAKAGNGVIVITTKKGAFNQPLRVSFNSNVTVRKEPDLFKIPNLSSADYIDAEKQLFNLGAYDDDINSTFLPLSPTVEILLKERNGGITAGEAQSQLNMLKQMDIRNDFQKYLYRDGVNQQYALNMSMGREKMKSFFSVGYDKGTDILVGNGTNRFTLRLDNTFKPVKNLLIRLGAGYTQTLTHSNSPLQYTNQVDEFNKRKLPLYVSLVDVYGNPSSIMYDLRETYTDTLAGGKLLDWKYRPLQELANNNNTLRTHALVGDLDVKYNFTSSLSGEIKYQYQRYVDKNDNHYNLETYYARDLINMFTQVDNNNITYAIPAGDIAVDKDGYMNTHAVRAQLNFNKNWGSRHRINAMGGFELRQNNSWLNLYYTYAGKVRTDSLYTLVTGEENNIQPDDYNTNNLDTRFVSWYGNASYTFNERYLITVSGRKDESNLFGVKSNQKGVPLWSVGGGWKISKESFYSSSFLDYLNFKITYGYCGNVNNSLSALTTIYRFTTSQANIPYTSVANYPNPRLTWEKVRTFNTGFDFASSNKRIEGNIEFFSKKSTDVVANKLLDPTVGIPFLKTNSASISGTGVDFQINTLNINNPSFKWRSSFIYNHITYKVSRYFAPNKTVLVSDGLQINPLEGYNPYLLVSARWEGLDANGDPQGFLNGQVSKNYDVILSASSVSDYHISGSALPANFGNFMNIFSWKNLSVSVNITYRLNYFFRKPTINYANLQFLLSGHPDYLLRWQKPGDEATTNVPALRYPNVSKRDYFYTNSEVNVEKGDNIRLDDIRAGYDIDVKKIKWLPVRSMQLYLYITNMNTILWKANKAGIDPEFPSGIKPALSLATGLKVDF